MREFTTKVTKDKYIIQYETDNELEYECLQSVCRAYIDGAEKTYLKRQFAELEKARKEK